MVSLARIAQPNVIDALSLAASILSLLRRERDTLAPPSVYVRLFLEVKLSQQRMHGPSIRLVNRELIAYNRLAPAECLKNQTH